MRDYLTIADLVAMPHLGLELAAGSAGSGNSVLWTHTSELEDPGPWLEGGELLIVNGFGISADPAVQVEYLARLARHRLAGLAVSVKAPELTPELLAEADRLSFPVLRVPRQVPFIELSYLVANASERSQRGRLARHLRVFDTLRFRNSADGTVARFYEKLQDVSGYRLALLSPAGAPLLAEWEWIPDDVDLDSVRGSTGTTVLDDGYIIPLMVGDRVTAYLVGKSHDGAEPGGLAALQHVSTLAALDAVDDQRRREAQHREGAALLSAALEAGADVDDIAEQLGARGLEPRHGLRYLAVGAPDGDGVDEIAVRDWLADRRIPHVLHVVDGVVEALVRLRKPESITMATDLGLGVGASPRFEFIGEVARMRRLATWSLGLTGADDMFVLAERQIGLGRWLNPDVQTLRLLADDTLHPLIMNDRESGMDLVQTLAMYFRNHGSVRKTAAQLFVHEHTLAYRLKRIEQLTGKSTKNYGELFELWLAIETRSHIDER